MAHFNVPIVPLTTTPQQQQQQCQRFHVRYQGVEEEDKTGVFVDSQAPLSSQHFPLSLSLLFPTRIEQSGILLHQTLWRINFYLIYFGLTRSKGLHPIVL